MAVTVQQSPSVVLDADYRIVEVGPSAEGGFGPLAGKNLWECFPGSESLFRPYYDKARRTGAVEEFVQFYNGYVTRVRAEPRGDDLAVWWDKLHVIDGLTLTSLEDSIARTIAVIDDEHSSALRLQARGSLRLIAGGA
ncbi:MAG TPA: hypothetical protein VMK83_09935 [Gaiellaceae bacterium]|nr:hypothetical protein [Gaiellaceae bacterium]